MFGICFVIVVFGNVNFFIVVGIFGFCGFVWFFIWILVLVFVLIWVRVLVCFFFIWIGMFFVVCVWILICVRVFVWGDIFRDFLGGEIFGCDFVGEKFDCCICERIGEVVEFNSEICLGWFVFGFIFKEIGFVIFVIWFVVYIWIIVFRGECIVIWFFLDGFFSFLLFLILFDNDFFNVWRIIFLLFFFVINFDLLWEIFNNSLFWDEGVFFTYVFIGWEIVCEIFFCFINVDIFVVFFLSDGLIFILGIGGWGGGDGILVLGIICLLNLL